MLFSRHLNLLWLLTVLYVSGCVQIRPERGAWCGSVTSLLAYTRDGSSAEVLAFVIDANRNAELPLVLIAGTPIITDKKSVALAPGSLPADRSIRIRGKLTTLLDSGVRDRSNRKLFRKPGGVGLHYVALQISGWAECDEDP